MWGPLFPCDECGELFIPCCAVCVEWFRTHCCALCPVCALNPDADDDDKEYCDVCYVKLDPETSTWVLRPGRFDNLLYCPEHVPSDLAGHRTIVIRDGEVAYCSTCQEEIPNLEYLLKEAN